MQRHHRKWPGQKQIQALCFELVFVDCFSYGLLLCFFLWVCKLWSPSLLICYLLTWDWICDALHSPNLLKKNVFRISESLSVSVSETRSEIRISEFSDTDSNFYYPKISDIRLWTPLPISCLSAILRLKNIFTLFI